MHIGKLGFSIGDQQLAFLEISESLTISTSTHYPISNNNTVLYIVHPESKAALMGKP